MKTTRNNENFHALSKSLIFFEETLKLEFWRKNLITKKYLANLAEYEHDQFLICQPTGREFSMLSENLILQFIKKTLCNDSIKAKVNCEGYISIRSKNKEVINRQRYRKCNN